MQNRLFASCGRVSRRSTRSRALATIRELLMVFIQRIGLSRSTTERLALLGDETLLSAVNVLGLSSTTLKEETLMSKLNKTDAAH